MEAEKAKKNKARSPQYPSIGLVEAIEKARKIYEKDYQNKTSRAVIVDHMGYQGLNGKSLSVLSALLKFGLLEGRADETYVSDLAVKIIAHPQGSPERIAALKEAAAKPELFGELDERFNGGKVSDTAIKAYLQTQKFIPSAADSVIRSYRETKNLVDTESGGYNDNLPPAKEDEVQENNLNQDLIGNSFPAGGRPASDKPPLAGMRKAIFTLDEGDVVIAFPENLSSNSVQELEDYLEIFMKKAKRQAGIEG